jgi:hypothetical protein
MVEKKVIMGIEDYGIVLQPCDGLSVEKAEVIDLLCGMGFHIDEAAEQFSNEAAFVARRTNGIVEALVRFRNDTVDYLSIRIAVCQPFTLVDDFFCIVKGISKISGMCVYEGYANKIYRSSDDMSDLYQHIATKVKHLKLTWSTLFQGDEEVWWTPFVDSEPSRFLGGFRSATVHG